MGARDGRPPVGGGAGHERCAEHLQRPDDPRLFRVHTDALRTTVSACRTRRALTERGASAATPAPAALMALLRSHGDAPGAPVRARQRRDGGAVSCAPAVCSRHRRRPRRGYPNCAPLGRPALGHGDEQAPFTSLFKPVRVDDPVDLGATPAGRLRPPHHLVASRASAPLVMRDPEASYPRFVAERDALEREWLASPPTGAAAFAQADALLAQSGLSGSRPTCRQTPALCGSAGTGGCGTGAPPSRWGGAG